MRCSFIFYGSLLEEEWRNKVTKMIPHSISEGYIFGEMAVISEFKSKEICRYPILSVENQILKIAAENIVYEGSNQDIDLLMQRLCEYEGPLYQLVLTNFYSEDRPIRSGFVFTENRLYTPCEAMQIDRIANTLPLFDWRKYATQFL